MNWRPDNRRYQYWWQHVDVRRPDRREHHRRFVNVRRLVDGRRWQHNDRRRRRLRRWWRRRWRRWRSWRTRRRRHCHRNANRIVRRIVVWRCIGWGVDAHAVERAWQHIGGQPNRDVELQEFARVERDRRILAGQIVADGCAAPWRRRAFGRGARRQRIGDLGRARPGTWAAVHQPDREGAQSSRLTINLRLRLYHLEIGGRRGRRRSFGRRRCRLVRRRRWRRRHRIDRDADSVVCGIWIGESPGG